MNKPLAEQQVALNKELVTLRKQLGLSQPQFAKKIGYGVGAVRRWEQLISPVPDVVLLYLREYIKNLTVDQ